MRFDPKRIIRLRMENGWHQAELARQAGLSRAYISMIENNEREPSGPAIKAIADALGVPVAALESTGPVDVTCPRCGQHFVA